MLHSWSSMVRRTASGRVRDAALRGRSVHTTMVEELELESSHAARKRSEDGNCLRSDLIIRTCSEEKKKPLLICALGRLYFAQTSSPSFTISQIPWAPQLALFNPNFHPSLLPLFLRLNRLPEAYIVLFLFLLLGLQLLLKLFLQ